MSERMNGEISIGGPVRRADVPELIQQISKAGVTLGWDGPRFHARDGDELLKLAQFDDGTPGALGLMDHEARYGMFEELEAFLRAHEIAYDRRSDAKDEYDAELVRFRPGMAEPFEQITNQAGEPVVVVSRLAAGPSALEGKTSRPKRGPPLKTVVRLVNSRPRTVIHSGGRQCPSEPNGSSPSCSSNIAGSGCITPTKTPIVTFREPAGLPWIPCAARMSATARNRPVFSSLMSATSPTSGRTTIHPSWSAPPTIGPTGGRGRSTKPTAARMPIFAGSSWKRSNASFSCPGSRSAGPMQEPEGGPFVRYRVHLFATVRVEHELEAESPEAAAIAASNADLHLYERFDRAGQEYAEQLDDLVLVDPLTEFRDELGRRLPDYDLADWYELTHRRTPEAAGSSKPTRRRPTGLAFRTKQSRRPKNLLSPKARIHEPTPSQ